MIRVVTFIDADAHIEESLDTWKYLDPRFGERSPQPVVVQDRPPMFGHHAFWFIDGAAVPRVGGRSMSFFATPTSSRSAKRKPFSIGSQELTSVEERLADLDRYDIDWQVVNPTLFNTQLTPDKAYEQALVTAYNTWISEQCAKGGGRLRWTAIMKLRDVEAAVRELHRVSELGAVAAEIHGLAGDETIEGRELDPFWAAAETLGMPVYVHVGFASPALGALFKSMFMTITFVNRLSVLLGFLAIVGTGIAERFPSLKFAFVEAGSEWVPWMVGLMEDYWRLGRGPFGDRPEFGHSRTNPREIVREGNIYVVCEPGEHLAEVLNVVGPDRLMLGSDMPHSESHPNSKATLEARDDLDDATKRKILGDNALRYFRV
jgi:uncharacterized protein